MESGASDEAGRFSGGSAINSLDCATVMPCMYCVAYPEGWANFCDRIVFLHERRGPGNESFSGQRSAGLNQALCGCWPKHRDAPEWRHRWTLARQDRFGCMLRWCSCEPKVQHERVRYFVNDSSSDSQTLGKNLSCPLSSFFTRMLWKVFSFSSPDPCS